MNSRFVLRDEFFGGTLYDRERMIHKFVSQDNLNKGEITWDGMYITKYEKWGGQLDSISTKIIFSPIRVYFELTTRCNSHCRHCFVSAGEPRDQELSFDEILASLEQMRRDNIFDIRFTGGELTQHPDWFEILKYAKSLGLTVSINTNGMYGSPEVFDQLASLDLSQITLSIEGKEKLHDSIRGKGSCKRTLAALQQLSDRGCQLRINTVVTKNTPQDVDEILKIAGQFVSEINFFYMRPIGRGAQLADQLISFERLHELNQALDEKRKQYPDLNVLYRSTSCLKRSAIPIGNDVGLKLAGCPAGLTRFGITSDGSMYACCYFAFVDQGANLGYIQENDYSVQKIWQHSPKLWQFREENMKQVIKCADCLEHWSRCPGACMAMEMTHIDNQGLNRNPFCIHRPA